MRKDFLPFTRPEVNDNDIAEVVSVLKSGWLTNGPKNAAFEEKICEYTNCKMRLLYLPPLPVCIFFLKLWESGRGMKL